MKTCQPYLYLHYLQTLQTLQFSYQRTKPSYSGQYHNISLHTYSVMHSSQIVLILSCTNFKMFKPPKSVFYSFYQSCESIDSYSILYYTIQYETMLYYIILYPTVQFLESRVIILLFCHKNCYTMTFLSNNKTCTLFNLRLMKGLCSITPSEVLFFRGRRSALTSFYFHHSEISLYLCLYPSFRFFLQLQLSLQL